MEGNSAQQFLSLEKNIINLNGSWRLINLNLIGAELKNKFNLLENSNESKLTLDGHNLKSVDTSSASLLIRNLINTNHEPKNLEFINFSSNHHKIFLMVIEKLAPLKPLRSPNQLNSIEQFGKLTLSSFKEAKELITFFGEAVYETGKGVIKPSSLRLKELFVIIERDGINAIPICALVTFLIGIVLAYLFGIQIEQYGANIFIVDAVGIAMIRELSPIIVAIIVAGRSGSAFTAHIGAMKINEELDAMITLGLSPTRVLVLPRVFGLIISLPLLVFAGNIAGIAGGMLIADAQLGITFHTFIDRLQSVIPFDSYLVGLIKAPVFATTIAIIGCRSGLLVENNARSLGMNTTTTVVKSIVCVILLNAAFAVIFQKLGL